MPVQQAGESSVTAADELTGVWPRVLESLRARLSGSEQKRGVNTWLGTSKVRPCGIEGGKLVLACPTPLFQLMIRDRYAELLTHALDEAAGVSVEGVVCRVSRHALRQHRERIAGQDAAGRPTTKEYEAAAMAEGGTRRQRHSFGKGFKILRDFVVGSCNRLAFDAISRILEHPAHPVNPLFIHGSSGLGKTHLEQGLAVAFKERYPHTKIVYMSCEQFRNHYLSACEKGTAGLQAFRVRLRHADLLLIDDIHFLSRGQMVQTKEELFSTFNELAERGKKVVITSDAHPSDIKYLEDRFIQRFTGGLVVMLDRPDAHVRREVVRSKASSQGVELSDDVADFVADHITDNVRELEGAVNKIVAFANSFGRRVDLQLVRQALADLIVRDASESRLKMILRTVADYFDLSVEDILGRGRGGSRSTARHIAMYVLKASGSDTYAAVGQAFGVKSHSSVAYACEQVARYRACDSELDRFVEDLLMRVRRR